MINGRYVTLFDLYFDYHSPMFYRHPTFTDLRVHGFSNFVNHRTGRKGNTFAGYVKFNDKPYKYSSEIVSSTNCVHMPYPLDNKDRSLYQQIYYKIFFNSERFKSGLVLAGTEKKNKKERVELKNEELKAFEDYHSEELNKVGIEANTQDTGSQNSSEISWKRGALPNE